MRRLALVLVLVAGCSGDAKSPPVAPSPAEGRVMLENQTAYGVEVVFLDGEEHLVRTQVKAGQVQEVSGGSLPGGTAWTFDLVLLLPAEMGYRVRRKVEVLIEGEVQLRASLEDPLDPFSLRFGRVES